MTKRVDLIWVVLAVLATALGIWLGVAGADASPIFTQAPSVIGEGQG